MGSDSSPGSRDDYLQLARSRQEHLRTSYFQQESRAQVVLGLTTAVGGALLGSLGGQLAKLDQKGGTVLIVLWAMTALTLVGAFIFSAAVVVPLHGRHFVSAGSLLDRLLSFVGFACAGARRPNRGVRPKPGNNRELAATAATLLHMQLPAELDLSDDAAVRSELYRLWALGFVTTRKSGLLRFAVLLLAVGLVAALATYLLTKEALV